MIKKFNFKYLISCLVYYLFFASSNAFVPLPLPLPVGPSTKTVADLKDKASLAADYLLSTIGGIQILLLVLFVWFIVWVSFRIFHFLRKRHIDRLRLLFGRLCSEMILKEAKQTEKELSLKETIYYIEEIINKRFFARRVGEHFKLRIADGLVSIRDNKLALDKQLALVECWLKALVVFDK